MREKQIYLVGYIVGLVIVVACVLALIHDYGPKNRAYASVDTPVEEIITETETEPKKGALSAMPCEAPELLQSWLEENTTEETTTETIEDTTEETTEETEETTAESSEETIQETIEETETSNVGKTWVCNGEVLDRGITDALIEALERHGIGYWASGAIAQMYQESHVQPYQISDDGLDFGIMQYRAEFWGDVCAQYGYPGADIYDIYVQFDIYATQMANRFGSGMSVPDAVSRHMTSDYGGFDAKYYSDVSRWFDLVGVIE